MAAPVLRVLAELPAFEPALAPFGDYSAMVHIHRLVLETVFARHYGLGMVPPESDLHVSAISAVTFRDGDGNHREGVGGVVGPYAGKPAITVIIINDEEGTTLVCAATGAWLARFGDAS